MKKNKKGFTLSEVLVCLAIIGVIMAISVNSIRIVRESYTSLTYFAYNNLKNMIGVLYSGDSAVFGSILEDDNKTYLDSMVTQCRKDDGTIVQVLKSDSETYGISNCSARGSAGGSNSNLFCRSLAAISNTAGEINCSTFAQVGFQGNAYGTQEPYISSYIYNKPNFVTTNGQRFYISDWTFDSANVSSDYGFRLVAIDLNATSRPNKITVDNSVRPPDIVTFMVLDNGEVFPLGVAADNLEISSDGRVFQYLNSKVKGYYYGYDSDRTENVPSECTIGDEKTCNYAVVYLQNDEGTSFFSFREAYCTSKADTELAYSAYCNNISVNEYCPPNVNEKSFDLCQAHTVKPLFRYNFR